jgi:hypothetical protein
VTGPELKKLRKDLGEAIGRPLTVADMAKLCGLTTADGADTVRKWEVTGPANPARGTIFRVDIMAVEHVEHLEDRVAVDGQRPLPDPRDVQRVRPP